MKNLKTLGKRISNKKYRVYVTFVDWFDNIYKASLLRRNTLEEVMKELKDESETNEWFQKAVIYFYKRTGEDRIRRIRKEIVLTKVGA